MTGRWRQELAGIAGFKIGIAWQGARDFRLDRWRSIPLRHFAPLARVPGVRLVSLQKGFGAEQMAAVDFPIVDWSDRLDGAAGPLMDTAAVISNLDLVISSDTAIPHLAGALGAPVWVALHKVPDWRWLLDRDDSPWYPTMRLFRQATLGDWPDVFERIAQAVGKLRLAILAPGGTKLMSSAGGPSEERSELDALLSQAVAHHQAGRLVEAAAVYRKILALRPDMIEVRNNLGLVLRNQGQLDEAIQQFEHALRSAPRLCRSPLQSRHDPEATRQARRGGGKF